MKALKNLRVGSRLAIAFAVVTVLMVAHQARSLAEAVAVFQVERPAAAAAQVPQATAPAFTGRAAAARQPAARPLATAALATQAALEAF